jgi:molecular chaperone GrpE
MTMNTNTPGDDMPAESRAAPDGDAAGLSPNGTSAATAQEPDPVATLEAERLDLKDKLLRTLADMENLRRRTEREVADARAYAVTNFARDMLTAADNIRRALDSVPADQREIEGPLKSLIEGIELTERDFLKSLERHGVRRLDPKGSKFDPNMHQAMFEVPNPEVPAGTVMEVVQTGYAIADRVLRPALVGVAKGGPKQGGNGAEAGSA